MVSSPQDVAIIGDDVLSDLGGGAKELKLHRFLGERSWEKGFVYYAEY